MYNKLQTFLISILMLALMPALSFSGEIELPKTGQTTCYDESGNEIPCSGTGQDGDIQAGVEWPSPRFTDNWDGTVTDNLTGLIWLKNMASSGTKNWATAVTFCNNLASGSPGLTDGSMVGDWRMPNIVELESLIDVENFNPALPLGQPFSDIWLDGYYWSATTVASEMTRAWAVYMGDGGMRAILKSSSLTYVLPVRGIQGGAAATWQTGQTTSYASGDDGDIRAGVEWPSPRFTDNGDGTVSDRLTGLVWLKNADCGGAMSFQNALDFCNGFACGQFGLTDGSGAGNWHLPNQKELMSLVDYSQLSPSLPLGHPFINLQRYYWSSTSYKNDSSWSLVWSIPEGGNQGWLIDSKSKSLYVWPVRSAQSVTPDPACMSKKLKTAGKLCTSLIKCWVKDIKDTKGTYDIKNFTGLAIQKFGTSWDKTQTKAVNKCLNCNAGSKEEIGAMINSRFINIYNQIYSITGQTNNDSIKLGSYLLKITGKRCSSLLNVQSAYIKDKTAKNVSKIKKAVLKSNNAFLSGFVKAQDMADKKQLLWDDSIKDDLNQAINDLLSTILDDMNMGI